MAADAALPDERAEPGAELAILTRVQRTAFDYFLQHANPVNGLVADTTRSGSPSSIAVVGFALSSYPVGVERGWIDRADAVERTLATLRFFMESDQSGRPGSTGYRGFYYHFLDMRSGARVWSSELSLIDTAFLIARMLTAALYFGAETPPEAELRRIADALYRRVDWQWAQREGNALMHGWKPESGFLHYGWEGYSEALLLYMLGLGSPTHALTPESFHAWTVTYQWESLYGIVVSLCRPSLAARSATALGARVALIERDLLGGNCLNYGCVPSKPLIRTARLY